MKHRPVTTIVAVVVVVILLATLLMGCGSDATQQYESPPVDDIPAGQTISEQAFNYGWVETIILDGHTCYLASDSQDIDLTCPNFTEE